MGCSTSDNNSIGPRRSKSKAVDIVGLAARSTIFQMAALNIPLQAQCDKCKKDFAKILFDQHFSICEKNQRLKEFQTQLAQGQLQTQVKVLYQQEASTLQFHIKAEVMAYKHKLKVVREIYQRAKTFKIQDQKQTAAKSSQQAKPPKVKMPKYEDLQSTRITEDLGKDCPVCLDALSKGDDVLILPCLHMYHRGCMQKLVSKTGKKQCVVDRLQLR